MPGTRAVALLLAVLCAIPAGCGTQERATTAGSPPAASAVIGDAALAGAFRDHSRARAVEATGVVTRLLADDAEGGRHQRFVLRLGSGQTVLVAHNIDVAPRVTPLRLGDTVGFRGEYEWNAQGGVVHWTHHDPEGRHAGGWIRHGGRRYE